MIKNKTIMLLFVVVAVVQLATPLLMVWRWEDVLQTGRLSYWLTAPVDPYDAFKGRYVDLAFKETTGPVLDNAHFDYDQTAYALIGDAADGKAFISGVTPNPPAQALYVKVKVYYVEGNTAHIALPFKRYYLPEDLAPAAEIAYRQSAGQTGVAAIRIKNGYGVVEQLYIGDKTIYEYLRAGK